MKPSLYGALATLALLASLSFFFECVRFLSRRDYVAAFVLFFIGLALSRLASDLGRFALARSLGAKATPADPGSPGAGANTRE